MKRNALICIVIWSITIVVLCGILLGTVVLVRSGVSESPLESMAAVLTEMPNSGNSVPAIVTENLNVRSSPNPDATSIGILQVSDQIHVSRQENVNGLDWYFITSPMTGWVRSEYVEIGESTTSETVYVESADGKSVFSASEITELEIEWAAGDILIQPGFTDRITVTEEGVSQEKYAMVLKQKGDTLKITFCDDDLNKFIGLNTVDVDKDLTITVPIDWVCESLEIDAASATVKVHDLTIREVDFDGASGTCEFRNCIVSEMDIGTASGDVRFSGSLGTLDCDAASASVYAVLSNVPRRLDMDMMSGDLELTLPTEAGFSLALDTLSGNFDSDFETSMQGGNYVSGDGSCRINVSALSGDVFILKAAALPQETVPETTIETTPVENTF